MDTQTATGNGTSTMTNHVELSPHHSERQPGDRPRPHQDEHRLQHQDQDQDQDQKGQR